MPILMGINFKADLSCQENLSKGIKIIKEQIEQHYKKLVEYSIENKLDLPQVFIDLFATSPNCLEVP